MNAFNRINRAATKLKVAADANLDKAGMRDVMLEVGDDLETLLDEIVDHWSTIKIAMRAIDGKERKTDE